MSKMMKKMFKILILRLSMSVKVLFASIDLFNHEHQIRLSVYLVIHATYPNKGMIIWLVLRIQIVQ